MNSIARDPLSRQAANVIETILTHPGGAHKDEFLACCLLIATYQAPLVRREPSEEDLLRAEVCVVDVGGEWEGERMNFDHHQFPRESEPQCALSLVLQHLELYEDARLFCDWLETAEWFDTRGPVETSQWLGVEREVLARLNSPIDLSLLRYFSGLQRLEVGDSFWEIMKIIGQDLLDYLRNLRLRLNVIAEQAEFWELSSGAKILFMPRTEPLADEPSLGLGRFVEQSEHAELVVGLVYPDRRGAGYGLSRYADDGRLEFTRIAGEVDVHFAHARGFVAKTSATERQRLLALVEQSWVEREEPVTS